MGGDEYIENAEYPGPPLPNATETTVVVPWFFLEQAREGGFVGGLYGSQNLGCCAGKAYW